MPWLFRVTDGADQGKTFYLPEAGVLVIGSSRKHADIALNDLYVARVHAELEIDGSRIVVTAHESPVGTLVNGQKIRQQELHHGDIIRMGNSHFRLEDTTAAPLEEVAPPEDDVPQLEVEEIGDDAGAENRLGAQARGEDVPELAVEEVASETLQFSATGTESAPPPAGHANGKVAAAPGKASPPTVVSAPSHLANLMELAGHELAHFKVEEVIAPGHAGVVFRARDLKKDQLVALKVIAPDFPHTEAEMNRFVQACKTMLPLRHSNLVTYSGAGRTGPFCWLAMELVENNPLTESIDRLSRKDKVDWHRGYRVAVQIGRALAYAHQHGVVHRNITARNVLWRTSDKVAKLSDLGLAAALAGSNLQKLALRDKLQAELLYLPPEQTQPDCFVDGVCDIYSLGVVVYALLTGRFPLTAPTQAELVNRIREVAPARPTKLQPEIPRRLESAVLKMLAKRQEDRYQKPEDLLADLEPVGQEQGVVV